MISNFELLSLPFHSSNSLFSLPREKSNDTKEPSSRIDEIIFRIEYRLLPTNSPRETFSGQSWLTRIVQTTRGEAISTSHLPKIPLIFHPSIFKTKAFHPLILEARLEHEQRDEEAAINSSFLSLSLVLGLHGDQSKILGTEERVDNGTVSFYTTSGTDISKLDDVSVAIALQKNARFEETQRNDPVFTFLSL